MCNTANVYQSPLPFYATQIINPSFFQWSLPIKKGGGISANREILIDKKIHGQNNIKKEYLYTLTLLACRRRECMIKLYLPDIVLNRNKLCIFLNFEFGISNFTYSLCRKLWDPKSLYFWTNIHFFLIKSILYQNYIIIIVNSSKWGTK